MADNVAVARKLRSRIRKNPGRHRYVFVIPALVFAVFVGPMPPTGSTGEIDRWIEQLSAANPETRLEAVEGLAASRSVPAEAVPALLDEARTELAAALRPAPPSDHGTPTSHIRLLGDEVSLERLKANAPDHIDKTFVLCGAIRLSDHYHYGYWDAEKTHYAFQFTALKTNEGHSAPENAVLYLLRQRGRRLAEQVVRLAEHGVDQAVVRVRATIVGYRHKAPENWRTLEVLDWQLLNPERNAWEPWAFAGFEACFVAIERAGHGAVRPLVELIAGPQGPESLSATLNTAAVRSLAAVVIGRAADFEQVAEAIRDAEQATDDVASRQRLTVALATIEELVREAGLRAEAAAILQEN